MSDGFPFAFALVAQTLRISVPYVLAALGGTVSERAGVVNLALEGMMLLGAFTATLGAEASGSVAGGIAAGALGGLGLALPLSLVAVRLGADQVVAGVALNLLALGLTRTWLKRIFGSASSSPEVPGFGGGAWETATLCATALVALGVHAYMARTPSGLRVRAVGEDPAAADSLGVDVAATRTRAVLASGLLAGLGGAWLAMANHGFTDQMSGGRGYIAVAAMIFGRWRPLGAVAACLLFGLAETVQLQLQTRGGAGLPRELLSSLPYLVTMVALVGATFRSRAPAALGVPFARR